MTGDALATRQHEAKKSSAETVRKCIRRIAWRLVYIYGGNVLISVGGAGCGGVVQEVEVQLSTQGLLQSKIWHMNKPKNGCEITGRDCAGLRFELRIVVP